MILLNEWALKSACVHASNVSHLSMFEEWALLLNLGAESQYSEWLVELGLKKKSQSNPAQLLNSLNGLGQVTTFTYKLPG